ncbi:MAG TPA: imidazole glycerol phosphate synthase cyclase subunit [Candidatus Omnitrophota bacterium]|nr:imidazole glycerol phosphate synthase cyclase subunit [Candidatus Omnitrophota bacterium]
MRNLRLIARLDIKGPNLIKGIHLEGLRILGNPQVFAKKYYDAGADEIIYMDSVASLYGRDNLIEIVRKTSQQVFIPMTVGGGIRSVENVTELLQVGADKVAVNTAAVKNPILLRDIAERFGSQCLVASIEAKQTGKNAWEAYTDNGREPSGLDAVKWAQQTQSLGAGEILLTSIDQEGTKKGFDVELLKAVSSKVSIPVIACGGMGNISHLVTVVTRGGADAVAFASVLHYNLLSFSDIRKAALNSGIKVRQCQ